MIDLEAKVWKGVSMLKKIEESKEKIEGQFKGLVQTETELISKLNEIKDLKSRCLGALELISNLEKEDDGVNDNKKSNK